MTTNDSNAQLAVDWLTYRSYEENRRLHPHVTPDRWEKLFPDAHTFEDIFTKSLKQYEDLCLYL